MYEIHTEDFYHDIKDDIHKYFETSDFPKDHESGIKTGINKKKVGKFKDEACGKQITHFVGLRSKLCAFKIDQIEGKKCKGIKKNVIKNELTFKDYVNCLFSGEGQKIRSMNIIRSIEHGIFSLKMNKIALPANDDKRITCKNKIKT